MHKRTACLPDTIRDDFAYLKHVFDQLPDIREATYACNWVPLPITWLIGYFFLILPISMGNYLTIMLPSLDTRLVNHVENHQHFLTQFSVIIDGLARMELYRYVYIIIYYHIYPSVKELQHEVCVRLPLVRLKFVLVWFVVMVNVRKVGSPQTSATNLNCSSIRLYFCNPRQLCVLLRQFLDSVFHRYTIEIELPWWQILESVNLWTEYFLSWSSFTLI